MSLNLANYEAQAQAAVKRFGGTVKQRSPSRWNPATRMRVPVAR